MADPLDLESQWQSNERRLNEIAAMTGLGREMHAAEAERLEGEQDRIEFELGKPHSPPRRWSGGEAWTPATWNLGNSSALATRHSESGR